ncbi:MAG: tetratricopeptide repeat protein [Pyrinomonadaceae bacterium]
MKKIFATLIVLILGYAGIFAVSRRLENIKPATDEAATDEDLYFSANQLKLLGADFRGLIADWYWVKSLQYLGDKVVRQQDKSDAAVDINDLRPLNPRLVYPMLDAASTLDPQFMTVYSYGAAVLPAIDNNLAIKLLEKGIAANPDEWRLYHNLGYIYWRAGNYPEAAEIYAAGSTKKDAPAWMRQMSANMRAQGGSRDFARQIYKQMFETAQDEQTRNFAELRFAQVESLDERDAIRAGLQNFARKNNRCVNNWQEISRELRAVKTSDGNLHFDSNGAPLDPTGEPYSLANQNGACDVKLSELSKIPQN